VPGESRPTITSLNQFAIPVEQLLQNHDVKSFRCRIASAADAITAPRASARWVNGRQVRRVSRCSVASKGGSGIFRESEKSSGAAAQRARRF
jgi:hypothetical protein